MPGGREDAATWADQQGRLWLFGGWGGFPSGCCALADLWVFDPAMGAHGEWAWMGGGYGNQAVSVYGTKYQFAPGNNPGPRCGLPVETGEPCVTWTGSDGRFWIFSGNGGGYGDELWVFDQSQGAHGEWAWMGGGKGSSEAAGVFGTEYQFAEGTHPPERASAFSWTDDAGRLWLFGGFSGVDWTFYNDLWVFDPAIGAHGEWAWMGGSDSSPSQPEVTGIEYQFAPANIPVGRSSGVAWTDHQGRMWLFGGYGNGPGGRRGDFSDLWVFDPAQGAHGEWAWMAGSASVCGSWGCSYPGVYGTEYVFDAANTPGARYGAVGWTGPGGNLWLYGGNTADVWRNKVAADSADLWEFKFFTPQTITFPAVPSTVTYGSAPIHLSATSSSHLPVTFSVLSGPGKVSGTNGSTLTFTGASSGVPVVIAASQAGDGTYGPAPPVTQSITVKHALLDIFADNKTMTYGSALPAFTWHANGFVNGDTAATALTGTPQMTTDGTAQSAPGTYPIHITFGTLASAKYGFAFGRGVLTIQSLGTVAKPTFTPVGGTYTGAQTVSINDSTASATIYYTTDGSTPSATHGTVYTIAITVSASETVKAIAIKTGCTTSAIASAAYTIH